MVVVVVERMRDEAGVEDEEEKRVGRMGFWLGRVCYERCMKGFLGGWACLGFWVDIVSCNDGMDCVHALWWLYYSHASGTLSPTRTTRS